MNVRVSVLRDFGKGNLQEIYKNSMSLPNGIEYPFAQVTKVLLFLYSYLKGISVQFHVSDESLT